MDVVSQLHLLEQVSSTEYIGSLTEALLKVLDEKEVVKKVCIHMHIYIHTYSRYITVLYLCVYMVYESTYVCI